MIRKILLVDADRILRVATEKRLAAYSEHFSVITAADGLEAVNKLKELSFSLIITDLILPRLGGMSLLGHIREKYPDLPVIVISSMRAGEKLNIVKDSDIFAYLTKPFQADELVSLIMSSLRGESDGGIMYDVSPTVFLQLMEMESKTCTIRIFDKVSDAGGVLYFIDGRLVDARVDDLRGIDAAYRVFTWEVVTIFIHNECAPRENTINSDLQTIIMTAVGMKDEADSPDLAEDDEEDLPPHLADSHAAADSSGHDLGMFLRKKVGEDCGIASCSFDETLSDTIDRLNELGADSGFGRFQVGYAVTGKKHDRIILPGRPAPILKIDPGCSRDRIIDALQSRDGKLPDSRQEAI